jgi:tripartite-type tricarboxylate transporter receptor subunit TctC
MIPYGQAQYDTTPASGPPSTTQRSRAVKFLGAVAGIAIAAALPLSAAHAQTYPDRPIQFILPFAPGGGTDILGRIVAQSLSPQLGQPVVPENRPGAGSHLGIALASKAKPDGYTMVITAPEFTTGPSLYKALDYKPKDLVPVTMVAQIAYVLTLGPSMPANNLQELIAYAKANPGKINYATPGNGSGPHIAVELLKSLTKIDIVHVPYKGAGPAMLAMLGGEVNMAVTATSSALANVQAGKIRAIAVLTTERAPELPNVPTTVEAGLPAWQVPLWWGIQVPAGTPKEAINRLNAAWAKAVALPATIETMKKAGYQPMHSTPEQFQTFIDTELVRWSKVISDAKIVVTE